MLRVQPKDIKPIGLLSDDSTRIAWSRFRRRNVSQTIIKTVVQDFSYLEMFEIYFDFKVRLHTTRPIVRLIWEKRHRHAGDKTCIRTTMADLTVHPPLLDM